MKSQQKNNYNAFAVRLERFRNRSRKSGRILFQIDIVNAAEFAGWRDVLVSVAEHIRDGEKVEAYSYKRKVRAEAGKHIVDAAKKTFETGDLPSRGETTKIASELARDFLSNPGQAIRNGWARERAFREAYKLSTGKVPPTKVQVLTAGAQKAAEGAAKLLKDNAEDLVVNAGGIVGSIAGGAATGGLGGQLAGDLAGAGAARKGVMDFRATKEAYNTLSATEEFKSASLIHRMKAVRDEALKNLARQKGRNEIDVANDVAGWAVGNTADEAISTLVPSIAGVPLKGMVAASITSPKTEKAYRRLKAGENAGVVAKDLAKDVAGIPKEVVEAGNAREQQLRSVAKQQILKFKSEVGSLNLESLRSSAPPAPALPRTRIGRR
jgi:hypothetical protein